MHCLYLIQDFFWVDKYIFYEGKRGTDGVRYWPAIVQPVRQNWNTRLFKWFIFFKSYIEGVLSLDPALRLRKQTDQADTVPGLEKPRTVGGGKGDIKYDNYWHILDSHCIVTQ